MELTNRKINKNHVDKREKKNKRRRWKFKIYLGLLIVAIMSVYLWRYIFISIDSGHRGVLWRRFTGTQMSKSYSDGLTIVSPLDIMHIYDIRVQELHEKIEVLTKNGLMLRLDVSTRFRIIEEYLPKLHHNIGPDYVEKVIRPEVITSVRRVMGKYLLEEIYSKDEKGLLQELLKTIKENIDLAFPQSEKYVEFVTAVIMRLELPLDMQKAITAKLVEEQDFLKYQYSKDKALQEKERKILEAEGIKKFEEICKIPILKWAGIEATKEIAKSPNTKIVIIGTTSKDLPIILNTESGNLQGTAREDR
ncbi:prohibitin family protein [Candidatus Uabimicrobium sp. HlEnr_7]|uniref:prohibitin family protein n=1 Tax=Candidatus Uabimicrobium helgolandensis TaxID=3095367 RepID=UPI003556FA28